MRTRLRGCRLRECTRTAGRSLTAAALVGGLAVAPAVQVPAQASTTSPAMAAYTYEQRVQQQVNRVRRNRSLPALRWAACPDRLAERWSAHLAAHDLFHHRSMQTVLDGCAASYAAETLARGAIAPKRVVRLWMNSPGHRAILLTRKVRRIGVGATLDDGGRWVVVANFVRF